MAWLTVKEVALLCTVTESAIWKAIAQNKYEHCYVNGVGRGGKQLRIDLESLPAEAQARYHGEQEEKSANALMALTDEKRDIVSLKLAAVRAYQKFKKDYPKADNFSKKKSYVNFFRVMTLWLRARQQTVQS